MRHIMRGFVLGLLLGTFSDVTVVRVKYPAGRKTAWFYDRHGNAYRARDFSKEAEVISVEM